MMAVSRLLKSWATPPASRPTVSIFCACSSCCSRRWCSVMLRATAIIIGRAAEVEHGDAHFDRHLGARFGDEGVLEQVALAALEALAGLRCDPPEA